MKNMKFASTVVLLVIGFNVWFTDRIITLIETTSFEPAVLIGTWFAWTTGELWMLKDIKKKKIDKEANKEVWEYDRENKD